LLEESRGDLLAPKELAGLMLDDPLFAMRLLKEANKRIPRRLGRDITTPLGAVLALGTAVYAEQLLAAPEADESNAGFSECESRATLASRIAYQFGSYHHDLDPGELALASLLSNSSEIELWAFAPELPQAVLEELKSGRARRSEQAQRQACGFPFKDLTLLLSERWQLPPLIMQLIRGDESLRAKLARLAVDTARHLGNGAGDLALPFDVNEVSRLTGASLANVVNSLPLLTGEDKAALLISAEACRANPP
jgi:HD-like signal output (HDOD) protein